MKIIGLQDDRTYVAIVSHTELEKCANKYYNKLPSLKVGNEFDIGLGHDYAGSIESACRSMMEAMKTFERARETLTKFAAMVAEHQQSETDNKC